MADGVAEEDDEPDVEYINWSLRIFADKGPTVQGVQSAITHQQYSFVNYGITEDFFENKYLPFPSLSLMQIMKRSNMNFILPYSVT